MSTDSGTKQVVKERQRNRHFMQCIPWVLSKDSQHMPQISWASCIFHILNSLQKIPSAQHELWPWVWLPTLYTALQHKQPLLFLLPQLHLLLPVEGHTTHILASSISCYKIITLVSCSTVFIIFELKTKHKIAILGWLWGKPYFYAPQDLRVQVLLGSVDTRSLL